MTPHLYDPVKIKFSESKAEVETEESTTHNARFRAWRLADSSVSASNTDNAGIFLILPTPIYFELMSHGQFMTLIFDILTSIQVISALMIPT